MEIALIVNETIAEIVDVAKRYYSIDRHVDVAIDITYIAYYSDCDEFQVATGAPSNKSYNWCYKNATISIVSEEVKFTLGMRPLRGYIPCHMLIEQPLETASEHVSIGTIYTDVAFDSIGMMYTVEKSGHSYSEVVERPGRRIHGCMDHNVSKQIHEMEKTIRGRR